MNISITLRYLLYLIVYATLLIVGFKIEKHLHMKAEEHLLLTPIFYYSILFPVIFGVLLAIPTSGISLGRQIVKFHWEKMLIFGVPSLLILLFPAYYFTLIHWGKLIPLASLLHGNEKLHFLSGVVFGYTMIHSLEYNKKQVIQNNKRG